MRIAPGTDIPEWLMESVSAERMRTMAAVLRDPNPVHWDRSTCDALGFGRRTINQGPLGLSYMVNMLHAWAGPGCLRRLFMTFPKVVLDGDRIHARGRVKAVRRVGEETLADCEVWLEREPGDRPLVGEATVLLPAAWGVEA
jgi:acyl dehydratase